MQWTEITASIQITGQIIYFNCPFLGLKAKFIFENERRKGIVFQVFYNGTVILRVNFNCLTQQLRSRQTFFWSE